MSAHLRIAPSCVLALGILACGCDPASEHLGPPRRFVLAESITLTLPVETEWVRTVESERLLLEHDGLVLRVQEIRSDAPGASRSPESVAMSLATRYALGEQTGTLMHAACRYASVEGAQCLTGTFERGGVPWARRGAVVETGGHLVWLDVVGPADRTDDVEAWTESLSRTAALAGGV